VTVSFTYHHILDPVRRGVIIPVYHHVRRSVRATIPAYHYALDGMRRSVRTTIPAYRNVLGRTRQSVRATFPFNRYVFDRAHSSVRTAIPACRNALDRTPWSVRAGFLFSRYVLGLARRGIRTADPAYRYALHETRRSARTTLLFSRYVLGRARRDVRTVIPACRYALHRTRRSNRLTIPFSRYAFDGMRRGVRTTIPAYRTAVAGMGQSVRGAILFTCRYVPARVRRGIQPGTYAYRRAIDRMGRNARGAIFLTGRYFRDRARQTIQPSIPAYRGAVGSVGQGVRATVPLSYRSLLAGMRRGVRTGITGYRYSLDRLRQSVQATISFTSFRYGVIGAAALGALAPLFLVLYQSFLSAPFSNPNALLGLDAYQFVFADEDFSVAFGTTLLLAAGMTLIAVPLGAALAFLMLRTDVPARRWIEPLIVLPIFLPALVLAFGYVEAFGPAGIVTTTFHKWTMTAPWNVYSVPFLITIAGLTHVPYVYLCVAAALRDIGDREEAARSAGAGLWRVAFGVSLPMTVPAILLATALVFFLGFELFGLPLVLGDAQGLLVLSTYLFKLTNQLGAPPYQLMAVVIVIMVAIGLPLLSIQRVVAPVRYGGLSVGVPKPLRFTPFRLGLWRAPVFLAIALWLAATLLVPLAALTLRSFAATWGEGSALAQSLTFDHYRELLEYPNVVRSMVNTLGIGLVGGAAAGAFYTAIALATHRWRSAWTRAVDNLPLVLRAMPGLAAGLALLWLLLFFKPLTALRGTLVSIWLAYTFVWLSCGTRLISSTLLDVDRQLEDIARNVGATEGRTRLDITLPLMRNGLLAGWLLIFLLFVRDYSIGIYLLAPGNEVIGPLLVSLWGSGAIDPVSALSVINVVMIGAGLFVAVRLGAHFHA
jgi:iron(III) transport system permease protein